MGDGHLTRQAGVGIVSDATAQKFDLANLPARFLAFGWTAFVRAGEYNAGMNAARYFQRREDYQPLQTPRDSPFRQFTVRCLKCGSYRLRLAAQFDEAAGEIALVLFCPCCRQHERLRIEHC